MVAFEVFVIFTILFLFLKSKRSFSRYVIKLSGAGAERNIFGSTTLEARKVEKIPYFFFNH
jgi:hypothetical protein